MKKEGKPMLERENLQDEKVMQTDMSTPSKESESLMLQFHCLLLFLSSQAAANAMVKSGIQDGKIVLVSSTLGYMGLIGYSQYTPMKHAIRGQ